MKLKFAILAALSLFVQVDLCHAQNPGGVNLGSPAVIGDCVKYGPSAGVISTSGGPCGGSGGSPGGANLNVQFNNAGVFGGLTDVQLTARIQLATIALSGALPAWGGTTTKYFRDDGSYSAIPFTVITGTLGCSQLPTFTGDVTNTNCAMVTPKINGNAFPSSVADNQIAIGNGPSNFIFATIPNCVSGSLLYTAATHAFSCGSGSGTVTSAQISAGNQISVATTAGANPCTTTCNLTVSYNPTAPQFTKLTTSGTYNVPAGATRVVFKLVGGGGGGSGSGTNGGNGGDTCIALSGAACTSPVLDAGGGKGSAGAGVGGLGGTVSGSTACNMMSVAGGNGGGSGAVAGPGSNGAGSSLGGGGGGAAGGGANTGTAGSPDTGGGGGGGTTAGAQFQGGGSGATCWHNFQTPAASYTYAVGASGGGGSGGGAGGGTGNLLAEAYFN